MRGKDPPPPSCPSCPLKAGALEGHLSSVPSSRAEACRALRLGDLGRRFWRDQPSLLQLKLLALTLRETGSRGRVRGAEAGSSVSAHRGARRAAGLVS